MENKSIDVVVAGHICLDIIPKFSETKPRALNEVLIPGKLINVGEAVLSTGGAVSNTGLVLSKLGARVVFMAKVGADLFGKAILEMIKQRTGSLGEGMTVKKDEFTSYTIVLALPKIDRIFLHHPGTNDTFEYNDLKLELVKKSKLFHLGYPPLMRKLYLNEGEELVKIYKKVKELNVVTSLDVSLPDPESEGGKVNWEAVFKKLLPYVDIFLPSIEEACYMVNRSLYQKVRREAGSQDAVDYFSPEDFTKIAEQFLSWGAKIVSLKCGHRGFYVRTQAKSALRKISHFKASEIDNWSNRELWGPSFHVEKIASATGSGDSAVAGFLIAFLRRERLEETVRYANSVGAQNLREYDAVSGVGTWEEAQAMVKDKNLKLNQFQITTPGWKWRADFKIWQGPNDKTRGKNDGKI
jgi:sugar/nucleoside kinase (ribokinase family)